MHVYKLCNISQEVFFLLHGISYVIRLVTVMILISWCWFPKMFCCVTGREF